jgi:hypothetical protein
VPCIEGACGGGGDAALTLMSSEPYLFGTAALALASIHVEYVAPVEAVGLARVVVPETPPPRAA